MAQEDLLDHRQRAHRAMQALATEAESVTEKASTDRRVVSLAAQAITHALLHVADRIDSARVR